MCSSDLYFDEGACLYVQGVYEQRWGREEFQLKVKEISLLETTAAARTQSITLKMSIESITPQMVDSIETLCKQHQGKHQLKVTLLDYVNRNSLTFSSKKRQVLVSNEFVEALEKLGITYQLN